MTLVRHRVGRFDHIDNGQGNLTTQGFWFSGGISPNAGTRGYKGTDETNQVFQLIETFVGFELHPIDEDGIRKGIILQLPTQYAQTLNIFQIVG